MLLTKKKRYTIFSLAKKRTSFTRLHILITTPDHHKILHPQIHSLPKPHYNLSLQ